MARVWKDGDTCLGRAKHEEDLIKKRRDDRAQKYAFEAQTGRLKRLEVE